MEVRTDIIQKALTFIKHLDKQCRLIECHKFANLVNKIEIEYKWLWIITWRETWFGNDTYWIEKEKETLANTKKQKLLSELSTK